MDITASVYHNDLIMETILQFVPFEERENIELSSRRLYNLSKVTPSMQGIGLSLIFFEQNNVKAEFKKKFKPFLQAPFGFKVPYNLPINERHPSRKDFEGVFKICSKRFRYQIDKVYFDSRMDLNTLKLIHKYFKYITLFKCLLFDDDCIQYLKSEWTNSIEADQTTRTSFKNLEHFHCISKNNSNEKVFQLLNLLKSNYNLESGSWTQKKLPNLELGLTVSFTPSLTTTLPQLSTLTELRIEFKGEDEEIQFVAEFFRAIKIHNLKKLLIYNLTLNTEIIDLMAFHSTSKLENLQLINYDNISETRCVGYIIPNTLRSLNISGNIYIRDIQIISERCPHLKNFYFYPKYDLYFMSYAEEVHKMIFCLKNLEVCFIRFDMGPQFLIDLWDYHPSLTRLLCSVTDVNLSALDEIYFKLYGRIRKESSTIFPKGRFLVYLTLPIESELKKEIDFSKIIGVVFHKAMTEGFPQSY